MTPTADLAVVVVVWRRTDDLVACLEGLAAQDSDGFEVVVADNGAGIGDLVAPFATRLAIRIVDMGGNHGVCRARNAAAAATSAPLLAFLDDDAVPEPGWVRAWRTLFATTDAWAARGRVAPRSSAVLNDLARAYDLGAEVVPAVINTEGNCALRRDVYEALGGFDERLYGHEGAELSIRVLDRAGRDSAILYTPDAVIRHDYVDDVSGYVRKRFRHGRMLVHLDRGSAGRAARRSRRRSPWTAVRVALLPVKCLGVLAEVAGYAAARAGRRGGVLSAGSAPGGPARPNRPRDRAGGAARSPWPSVTAGRRRAVRG